MNKLIYFLAACFLMSSFPLSLRAQTTDVSLFGNLGGPIVKIEFCSCSFGLMLTIARKPTMIPVNIFYEPFVSRLNMNYNPFIIGNEVILQHTGVPITCQKYAVSGCYASGTALGTVTTFPFAGMGTTASPLKASASTK